MTRSDKSVVGMGWRVQEQGDDDLGVKGKRREKTEMKNMQNILKTTLNIRLALIETPEFL